MTSCRYGATPTPQNRHLNAKTSVAVDLVNFATLRACGLAGFHRKDERRHLLFCGNGSALVADEVPAIRIHHLAQAAAALGVEGAVRDEGEGHLCHRRMPVGWIMEFY
jgi:hypothetical protein